MASFEPAFADELAAILTWGFDYLQRDASGGLDRAAEGEAGPAAGQGAWLRDQEGGSVYLRLSTRPLDQPERTLDQATRDAVIEGGYWLVPPAPGAELAIVYSGAVAPEALSAHAAIAEDLPGTGLLAVTSADRLNAGWHAAQRARAAGQQEARSRIEGLLSNLAPNAGLITVLDGHPAALAWMGSVRGQRVQALGVEHFGQSGGLAELYGYYRIDEDAIIDAAAALCLGRDG